MYAGFSNRGDISRLYSHLITRIRHLHHYRHNFGPHSSPYGPRSVRERLTGDYVTSNSESFPVAAPELMSAGDESAANDRSLTKFIDETVHNKSESQFISPHRN
ncbi:hypothetical protein CDAR_186461 [Caerostris darwini]|uniref:Uncharacterized protein n=1 Tax=Caerostris darwini TaxID=1538125 RepID=A0AAV4TF58_9ARAC|nr:hypothetical protein CDAR_186461 [Caerostris darwini]